MAKVNVSARVPPMVANSLDEYEQEWNLNQTDALTVLLEYALQEHPHPEEVARIGAFDTRGSAYTVDLAPETNKFLVERAREEEITPNDVIRRAIQEYRDRTGEEE